MWSKEGQEERFRAVLAALNPQPVEILLDFGCGTGNLSTILPDGVGYIGYDWSEGMIERARRDHPHRFFTRDIPPHKVDLIACIGPFNLADSWSKEKTWGTLLNLWSLCNRAMAVSLYAGEDEDCISYLDSDCVTFAKEMPYAIWSLSRHRANDLLLLLER